MGLTATADCLGDAIKAAYRLTDGVTFSTKYLRHDIGAKALQAPEG